MGIKAVAGIVWYPISGGVSWVRRRFTRTQRTSFVWGRKWLRTSKPTEWLTAMTGILTVLSAITAGVFLVSNGFFDQKRSEMEARNAALEAKQSELRITITKAEMDRERIAETRGFIETKVSDAHIALKVKEKELADLSTELKQAKNKAAEYKLQSDELAKWDTIRSVFAKYSDGDYRTHLRVYKHKDEIEHPRGIYGLSITSDSHFGRIPKDQHKDIEEILNAAKKLPRVSVLSIDGIDIRPLGNYFLVEFEAIHELHLTNCKLEKTFAMFVPESCRKLNLEGNTALTSTQANIQRLTGLGVSGTQFGDKELLATITSARGLTELRCAATEVGDDFLKELPGKCKELQKLTCHDTPITNAGLKKYIKDTTGKRIVCSKKQFEAEEAKKLLADMKTDLQIIVIGEPYKFETTYGSTVIANKHGLGGSNPAGARFS